MATPETLVPLLHSTRTKVGKESYYLGYSSPRRRQSGECQKSTGPRSPEGKAGSARNHTSHGLRSKEFVLEPGEQADFEYVMDGLRDAVRPEGAVELDLFTQLAHASWTLRRCRHAEVHLQNSDLACGLDPLRRAECDPRLRTLDTYARRAERAYHKACTELKRLQSTRVFRNGIEDEPGFAAEHSDVPLARSEALVNPRARTGAILAEVEDAGRLGKAFAYISRHANVLNPHSAGFAQSNPIPDAALTAA